MRTLMECLTPGCERASRARGLCSGCYGKAYRAAEFEVAPDGGAHSLSEVDVEARTGVCSTCGPTKIRVRRGGRGNECGTKRRLEEKARRSRVNASAQHRRAKYGLEDDDFARMWLDQDGECFICGAEADLVVDHCHRSGKVRGLLCGRCNVALGFMRDNPQSLRAAADYLERA